MAKLFDYDPITKTKQLFHWNHDDDSFHIETMQDVSDIVEFNKRVAATIDERAGWKGDWHHVGQIPLTEYYKLPQEMREDSKDLIKWLNDSANRAFRFRKI